MRMKRKKRIESVNDWLAFAKETKEKHRLLDREVLIKEIVPGVQAALEAGVSAKEIDQALAGLVAARIQEKFEGQEV